jgi:hypothetical protein
MKNSLAYYGTDEVMALKKAPGVHIITLSFVTGGEAK